MHMIAAAKSLQSCPTLCDPTDGSHQAPPPLGFSRQEHWSGLPFPSLMHESEKWKVKVKWLSHVRLLGTPWTAAYQAPPSIGFSRQEYAQIRLYGFPFFNGLKCINIIPCFVSGNPIKPTCVFLACVIIILVLWKFLSQDVPGSFCTFSDQALVP